MDTGKRSRRPRKSEENQNERGSSSDRKKSPSRKSNDSSQKDRKAYPEKKQYDRNSGSEYKKGSSRKADDSSQKDRKAYPEKKQYDRNSGSEYKKGSSRKADDAFQKDRKSYASRTIKPRLEETDSIESLQKRGEFKGSERVHKKEEDETLGRLNKYIANSGICSRRQADEYIAAGLVKVNDVIITEMGVKVKQGDVVKYNGERIRTEKKLYVLLNKPKDFVTTMDDPEGRKTVMDLVKSAGKERIYPVGRLDRNTTGVLLLTNDGELATKLTHPKYNHKKIYHVFLEQAMTQEDFDKMQAGIELEDGKIKPDGLSFVNPGSKAELGIEIHSGKNRLIRRMFEALEYKVTKLDRVYFAGLTKKGLSRGQWRYLSEKEISILRMSKLG